MKNDARQRARQRIDERLSALDSNRLQHPPKGWIRAIRDALGMSRPQLASRLGVRRPQTVETIEKSEANGTIQLSTLRRAAEALDCQLVYALVPKTSLEHAVRSRARQIATKDLQRVAQTMKLEAQETGESSLDARIEVYIRDQIRDRDLWNKR